MRMKDGGYHRKAAGSYPVSEYVWMRGDPRRLSQALQAGEADGRGRRRSKLLRLRCYGDDELGGGSVSRLGSWIQKLDSAGLDQSALSAATRGAAPCGEPLNDAAVLS